MQAVGASNKVFEFIDRKPEIRYDIGKLAPAQLEGRLEFKNVSFSYPSRPDTEVLKVRIDIDRPSGIQCCVRHGRSWVRAPNLHQCL